MKKTIALLLVVAAAFMMFSCGSAGTEQTTPTTQTTAATSASTEGTEDNLTWNITELAPYADIDFANGEMFEVNEVLTLEFKAAGAAAPATVEEAKVSFDGKSAEMTVLRITDAGAYVKATFSEFAGAKEFDSFVKENGGISIEAFYLDNSTGNTVRGIVCCTESVENGRASTRSGWGIAEDNGKPYFIAGNSQNNAYASVYAKESASENELVHVIAIFDNANQKISLYINGVLQNAKASAGEFTSADKQEYFEKFNMANIFYIGSDPTGQNRINGDFPADDLPVADVKIYAKALSKDEVAYAYHLASSLFE